MNICKLDPTEAFCIGCGRSLGELAVWSGATEAARALILVAAAARLRAVPLGDEERPRGAPSPTARPGRP